MKNLLYYTQGLSETVIPIAELTEINKHEGDFTRYLSSLLSILSDMSKIESERSWSHMITRLDYNSFYNCV